VSGSDVIVVGAGVIGTAVAWRCAGRGLSVTLVDPSPGAGATATAAGMLAPVTELHYEGRDLLRLNLDSAARYPALAAELAELTGIDIGYRTSGTLAVAWDAADLAALRDLQVFQASLGLTSEMLTGRELRAAEPSLVPGLPGGLLAGADHQVDSRRLHEALTAAASRAGVTTLRARVATITIEGSQAPGGRVTGVVTDAGDRLAAAHTVLAAGAWSRDIPGLPDELRPPVRPVKGQTVHLRGPATLLAHVVRGSVTGRLVYVVPRADGRVVVGASSEEVGFDARPRTGAVYELLRDAQALVPELNETEFVEVSTGFRPGSPDNAPLLGAAGPPGLVLATGHYRNGILLTPATADGIAAIVAGEGTPAIFAAFDPRRFHDPEVPA
jgi:glycine oxidase